MTVCNVREVTASVEFIENYHLTPAVPLNSIECVGVFQLIVLALKPKPVLFLVQVHLSLSADSFDSWKESE